MTRTKYWLSILLIPLVTGLISGYIARTDSESAALAFLSQAIMYYIAFGIPLIQFLRMRHLKFTWKEMLRSLVPFNRTKYRTRILFDPN